MENKSKWGSFSPPETPTVQIPDVSADIEYAMNKFFLNDFEEEEHLVPKTENIKIPPLNSLMSYGISLHKYKNNMLDIIERTSNDPKNIPQDDKKVDLKIPEQSDSQLFIKRNYLNYATTDFTDFSLGKDVEVPVLSNNVVNLILRKSVATIFAQIGYETCEETALNVLTDVLADFLKLFCNKFNVANENRELRQFDGFPHSIERVLTEVGMNGVKGLNDYYQTRVIKYSKLLYNRCQSLNEEYEKILIPRSPSPIANLSNIVKVEKEDVSEMENPEVHFPLLDGDVNFSILETGYQLLNSLEAEANLQSLAESVEDMPTTEPPAVIQVPTEETISLSPFNKKPRYK